MKLLVRLLMLAWLSFLFYVDVGDCTEDYKSKQPNIIYILSDDLGHADVGFTNGNIETPHLNKLASQGEENNNLQKP